MTRPKFSRLLIAGLTAGLGLALAGCSGAGHPNGDPSPGSVRAQALPVWREFTACVRGHGVANVPDPQVDENGQATWPGLSQAQIEVARQQVGGACDAILQKLPAAAQPGGQITEQELATLRRFAQCMRDHGLPDFPDPNSDGIFTMPPRINAGGKSLLRPATEACKDVYNGSFRTG
jgi:hypothetical protein